jgi:hypothetical protein
LDGDLFDSHWAPRTRHEAHRVLDERDTGAFVYGAAVQLEPRRLAHSRESFALVQKTLFAPGARQSAVLENTHIVGVELLHGSQWLAAREQLAKARYVLLQARHAPS